MPNSIDLVCPAVKLVRASTRSLIALLVAGCAGSGGFPPPEQTVETVPMPSFTAEISQKWLDEECSNIGSFNMRMKCEEVLAAKLPPLDLAHRELFGRYYNPRKYLQCMKEASNGSNVHCRLYRTRRIEYPEYWPYPDAPPVKWPEAPNPPTYREGMSKQEYFQALCEKEAGWFIYRSVENVDGIYEVRPRFHDVDRQLGDPYVVEDPWSATLAGWVSSVPPYAIQPYRGKYAFLESKRNYGRDDKAFIFKNGLFEQEKSSAQYYRYFRDENRKPVVDFLTGRNGKLLTVPFIVEQAAINKPSARFGFTWRGIVRPHFAEFLIQGGELIVLDLQTNEILGVRRTFMAHGDGKSSWLNAPACPNLREIDKSWKTDWQFIQAVLKPRPENADYQFKNPIGQK